LQTLTDYQLDKKIQQRFGTMRVKMGIAEPRSKKRSRFITSITHIASYSGTCAWQAAEAQAGMYAGMNDDTMANYGDHKQQPQQVRTARGPHHRFLHACVHPQTGMSLAGSPQRPCRACLCPYSSSAALYGYLDQLSTKMQALLLANTITHC
jgi:hypothetical protein